MVMRRRVTHLRGRGKRQEWADARIGVRYFTPQFNFPFSLNRRAIGFSFWQTIPIYFGGKPRHSKLP